MRKKTHPNPQTGGESNSSRRGTTHSVQASNTITLDDFYSAYQTFRKPPNNEQKQAIEPGHQEPLFIVAGPGTGKTTCLTLRILKLILVDGVPPRAILATTFTKKAAEELRSRILGWGFQLLETLQQYEQLSQQTRARLSKLDINQVLTGTIDSLCEQVLRDFRDPGTQPPILADDFVSKTLLLREGMFKNRRYLDNNLDAFLLNLRGGSRWGWNIGKKNDLLREIWERRFQDQVDWNAFLTGGSPAEQPALTLLGEALADYQKALSDRSMVDFALLEQEVLDRLREGKLTEFLQQIQVVLVDEYQDTNLLQEGIYFELAKACNGALTVVGDDDQSLYRFRGATVELFSDFRVRYDQVSKCKPTTVFLKTNYRSTQLIIKFVNDYATLDPSYQEVRAKSKPALLSGPTATKGIPVLAMFRNDVKTLARDLADFIHQIFRGNGYTLSDGTTIECNSEGGDIGDCALLCSSPAEYNSSNAPRLPLLLRQELLDKEPMVEVFNPRGQDLTGVPVVACFGGLLLECLDPLGVVEANTKGKGLTQEMIDTFQSWRDEARKFVKSDTAPKGLREFVTGWKMRDPQKPGLQWLRSVPVLELIYGLVHYFPELHDDPEGQTYLEVFTRQVSACEQVGNFSGRIVTAPDNPDLSNASIKEHLRDFLGPIAAGTSKVNEELMETFPRDRLSILSVHQSKGLEFPLTIVDVGSDFKNNHAAHRFKRFPNKGGTPQAMEDLLRPHTDLNAPNRSDTNRSFDDLYRQFFVAYSRPQEVLLLVGLQPTAPGGSVPNIATGWVRTGTCLWHNNSRFIQI